MKTEQVFIAITLDNGHVEVMGFVTVGRGGFPDGATPIHDSDGWWKREPSDRNLAFEISKAYSVGGKQPTRYRIVDHNLIPADRTYRDALVDDGNKLAHDMPKAREIHLRHVRDRRGPALDQLDRDWMRATGRGETKEAKRIEAERQALRDLPAMLGVEAASTTEELKARWPASLPKPKGWR